MAGAFAWTMGGPRRLRLARRAGRLLQGLAQRLPFSPLHSEGKNAGNENAGGKGWIRKAALPVLSQWTRSRDLPPIPPRSFRQLWRDEVGRETGSPDRDD